MEGRELDIDKLLDNVEKRKVGEIKRLELLSKKLCDLIVTERFTVNDVIVKSGATSFTPYSEMVIGGTSPVYRGGFTSRIVLEVLPDDKDIPIRTINFDGFSIVKAGDLIYAQIPKYREERLGRKIRIGMNDRNKVYYLSRDFTPEESAIELCILSEEGRILRRERSVSYENFAKK